MNPDLESLLNYLIIVVVGAALVWYDMRLFALYSFMVTAGLVIHLGGRLWKLIRVSHASNAAKIMVIAKKVGVSDDDFEQIAAALQKEDPKGWASVRRDFKDL